MTTIWEDVRNTGSGGFSPLEDWGDHSKVNGFLLWFLFTVRIETGWPIVIHNAFSLSGHSKTSQHYKGSAADWHFETETPYHIQIDRITQIMKNKQVDGFVGLGIYPQWNNKGFHTDTRGEKARWGYLNKDGKPVMVGFNEAYKFAWDEANNAD